jgi:hypothetical protein
VEYNRDVTAWVLGFPQRRLALLRPRMTKRRVGLLIAELALEDLLARNIAKFLGTSRIGEVCSVTSNLPVEEVWLIFVSGLQDRFLCLRQ